MPELLLLLLLFRLREGIVSVEALMLSSSVALLSVALPSNPRGHGEPAVAGCYARPPMVRGIGSCTQITLNRQVGVP